MFSGLNTPKLQTLGLTRKGRPFFMTYQTHFLRQYLWKYKKARLTDIILHTRHWSGIASSLLRK